MASIEPLGLSTIAENHPFLLAEPAQCAGVTGVVAFEVIDRDLQLGARRQCRRSAPSPTTRPELPPSCRGTGALGSSAGRRAGDRPRSAPEIRCRCRPPGRRQRRTGHRLHHRREAGDRPGTQIVTMGESTRKDEGVVPGGRGVAVPHQVGRCPRVAPSPGWRRARSWCRGRSLPRPGWPSGRRHASPCASRHRDPRSPGWRETVGHHRGLGPGVVLIRGRDLETERLPGPHAGDPGQPQGGQGPLDGGALRIGDAWPQPHLDHHREFRRRPRSGTVPVAEPPPADPLVGVDVAARVAETISAGSAGGGGCLSQGWSSSQSRNGCLSKEGGSVPGAHRRPARTGTSQASTPRRRSQSAPSMKPELEFGVRQMRCPAPRPGAPPSNTRPGTGRRPGGRLLAHQVDGLLEADVEVVALGGLGRRGEEGLGQPLGLAQPVGMAMPWTVPSRWYSF